jgi:hypothetical protein
LTVATRTPKFKIHNSVVEYAQSLKKENAGKFYDYGTKSYIACLVAGLLMVLLHISISMPAIVYIDSEH